MPAGAYLPRMQLHWIDVTIIIGYIIATLLIGFYISKRASRNMQSYFLGGNEIPWPALGLSNASGMFDISGTMWMVALLFVYGLKSVFIPWLWPVFNQIFLMIYLSVWLRRSGVMTGAEWIQFRFGRGRGAELSHLVVVAFALILVITYVAYGFIGVGKFATVFLPWELSADPALNEIYYGLIVTGLTAVYVIKGGMYSVVFTEVLQYFIMLIASVAIGIIAMTRVSPETLARYVPAGWEDVFFGRELALDWSDILPAVNGKIAEDGWELFGPFVGMVLISGVLKSMAGPAPNYDMQRILSTRTPKEAAKMSGFVNVVLLFPRYMLITGLAVLALVFFNEDLRAMGDDVDFEQILPFAMRNFVPVGLLGLLIAGLLAAFMSSFAATVNAAPAYLVNDIYKKYLNPDASQKTYVRMSYLVSVLIVIIGTLLGLFGGSLNDIVDWLGGALLGGYAAANLIKWYWWRFNGYGFFWGMMAGVGAAMLLPWLLPKETSGLEAFPLILLLSVVGCLAGTWLTKPDDMATLKRFYFRTRPWGFWGPVHRALLAEHPNLERNTGFARDAVNVAVGIVWQTAITAAPIFLVIQSYRHFGLALLVVAVCTLVLKYNWYDKLADYPAEVGE